MRIDSNIARVQYWAFTCFFLSGVRDIFAGGGTVGALHCSGVRFRVM